MRGRIRKLGGDASLVKMSQFVRCVVALNSHLKLGLLTSLRFEHQDGDGIELFIRYADDLKAFLLDNKPNIKFRSSTLRLLYEPFA